MNDKIVIFTMDGCPYCEELKNRLNQMGIDFMEANIKNRGYHINFNKISKYVESDLLPMVLMGKHILVGDKSYKTIEEASLIIKKLKG